MESKLTNRYAGAGAEMEGKRLLSRLRTRGKDFAINDLVKLQGRAQLNAAYDREEYIDCHFSQSNVRP